MSRSTDRAVSEVVGFVLVFSLVVSSIAIVSVFGLQSLEDTRDNEEVNNAQRAFDVLRDNLQDIHRLGAPSRATEISLENSQLRVGDSVGINITGVDVDTGTSATNTFTYQPIIFQSRTETDIVYSGGAVFLDPQRGGLMIQEPPMLINDDQFVFPVIQTQHVGGLTSLGGQTVRIRAEKRQRQPIRGGFTSPNSVYDQIIINITSPRNDLWRNYLEEQPSVSCVLPKENNVRCTVSDPDAVYVSRTLMAYAFEN